jgi:hypothetical protein
MIGKAKTRKKMLWTLLGVAAGGIVGFLYYKFVGCRTGACLLTSHPVRSILYWGLIGGLFASSLAR